MNPILPAVFVLCVVFHSALPRAQAQGLNNPPPATSTASAKSSTVVVVERPSAVLNFVADSSQVGDMFNSALGRFTGQTDVGAAWKSLGIVPADTVGIKIDTKGGQIMSTRRELVNAIIQGLMAAGVPPNQIIIWDKFADDMRQAGWAPVGATPRTPAIKSVIPGTGFDPKNFYVNEILGRLIWGDMQFRGMRPTAQDLMNAAAKAAQKANPAPGDDANAAAAPSQDQTSNKSFYATLLTQTCTKIINVPTLSDSTLTGLGGCLASLAIGSVDNTRRFTGDSTWGDPAVPEILDKDFVRKKVVLYVLDALIAQYAGGPSFNPVFTKSIGAIYVSKDPVAIDSIVLKRMEKWRSENYVDPLGDKASHVATAASYDLGTNDPKRINLIRLP
jgi:hypothetical protein